MLKELEELQQSLAEKHTELKGLVVKANEEAKVAGSLANETKSALEAVSGEASKLLTRLTALEQKWAEGAAPQDGTAGHGEFKSLGAQFVEGDAFKSLRQTGRGELQIKGSLLGAMEMKTAILNATGVSQPLVSVDRISGLIVPPNRVLRIRDLLPTGITSSNLVEYVKENVFTNNAGPQYQASPVAYENVLKPESGITFTLANAPVVTIAHWIPASRQVLDDAPMLESYIGQRLMYGLKLEEEDEILNGNGTAGTLNGLLNQATAFSTFASGDTELDKIRRAMTAVELSEFQTSGIVMNPADWRDVELLKDANGNYIFANPQEQATPRLWGVPVVKSTSIAAGTVLLGAFDLAAQIWDRLQARIEVSRENADNFVKNMITILCEERLALTVYRPTAFVKLSI